MSSSTTAPGGDDARATVGWLHRRAGFGLHPDDLAAAADVGVDAAYTSLVSATDDAPDPWDGLALDPQDGGRGEAIRNWLLRFLTTATPYLDRRTFVLHGWIVSGMDKAPPFAMVDQIRLLMRQGGGSFPDLLRAITVDRAMLVYLDGRTSTGSAPNENYGRELLELFALGVGEAPDGGEQPYTEDDVFAAAAALTGWVVRPDAPDAIFIPRRHDDTPRTLLGVEGVHDVDTVIDAVVSHPEHPRFVARRITAEYVGDPADGRLDGVVDTLADVYVTNDLALDPVIDAALRLALDGTSTPIVLDPIPWMFAAARALGADLRFLAAGERFLVREMGQVPLFPPSVAGWDGGTSWFTTSSLIARTNVASAMVETAQDGQPLVVAAEDGDLDELAILLGLTEPFGSTTAGAIRGAASPRAGLTLALVSPEALLS